MQFFEVSQHMHDGGCGVVWCESVLADGTCNDLCVHILSFFGMPSRS